VSADEGRTWTMLHTQYTTTTNPVGNNLGDGYTGRSGRGDTAHWVADKSDLTPFAGKKVLVRFEYVTDDAVTNPGFCVDDITVPELGFADDVETNSGWDAKGFVRSSNTIPQTYMLRLITVGQKTEVQQVPVDGRGLARISISGAKQAILAIAGTAPITTEQAEFRFSIEQP
jgi:immune inhibitor A